MKRWSRAWPDALAFSGGLGVAWYARWKTTDLVWSLWLSSLTVGYAMIVWGALSPAALRLLKGQWRDGAMLLATGCGLLLFFTLHFGLFHFVHATFLGSFFPVATGRSAFNFSTFHEVIQRYWWFLPMALLAERRAFRAPVSLKSEPRPDAPKTADLLTGKARELVGAATMFLPYLNVIRLHLLIFFFAFVHFARLDSFPVYAVVYAVYFLPWRLFLAPEDADMLP